MTLLGGGPHSILHATRGPDIARPGQSRPGAPGMVARDACQAQRTSRRTITHLENDQLKAQDDSHYLLRRAFENAGVIFVHEGNLSGVVIDEDVLGGSPGPLDGPET